MLRADEATGRADRRRAEKAEADEVHLARIARVETFLETDGSARYVPVFDDGSEGRRSRAIHRKTPRKALAAAQRSAATKYPDKPVVERPAGPSFRHVPGPEGAPGRWVLLEA
jgi:hypothetical protein